MNEIISTLERAKEKAYYMVAKTRLEPVLSDTLTHRAVLRMAYDHLTDTIHLFRHARRLKQKLGADSRSPKGDSGSVYKALFPEVAKSLEPLEEEQDAPD